MCLFSFDFLKSKIASLLLYDVTDNAELIDLSNMSIHYKCIFFNDWLIVSSFEPVFLQQQGLCDVTLRVFVLSLTAESDFTPISGGKNLNPYGFFGVAGW